LEPLDGAFAALIGIFVSKPTLAEGIIGRGALIVILALVYTIALLVGPKCAATIAVAFISCAL
jgi:hypothetical protein